jgi:SAM domain (Sterile alpha motif)
LKLGLIGLDVENLLPVDGSAAADVHRESVAVVWPAMGQGSLAKAGRMKRNNRGAAAMLADWLENLGLGQYTALCNDDVSFSVPPDLTDQHLKEIGVPLGHRATATSDS